MPPKVTRTIRANHPQARKMKQKYPGLYAIRYYRTEDGEKFKTIEIVEGKIMKFQFVFHTVDFGDHDHENYGKNVWVAAYVDGNPRKPIGAYVNEDGSIDTDDHQVWHIDHDLVEMGITPGSEEAEELLKQWFQSARRYGLKKLEEINA